jgi:aryl-alcohol dehydrogenase-like predicted oxidoreductase
MSSKQPVGVSRRSVVAAGLAGGVSLALSSRLALAAAQASPPITKTIPSSGEKLAVVGIGTNQYSVTAAEEIAARREVLEYLPKLGGKVVDTAWRYGDAEIVIGNLVKQIGNRDKLFVATKTATPGEGPAGAGALELALTRLQVQKIDLLQIHSFRGFEELYPVLVDAKKAGKIRYIGATSSTDEQYPQMLEALQKRSLDFIQVDYSIENQGAESILQVAKDKGVAVLINLPFGGSGGGSLIAKVRGKPLPEWAAEIDAASWPQLLLKYTIAHPSVTTVIPGTTKLAHLEDNQLAGRGRLPDAAFRKKIEQNWATI